MITVLKKPIIRQLSRPLLYAHRAQQASYISAQNVYKRSGYILRTHSEYTNTSIKEK